MSVLKESIDYPSPSAGFVKKQSVKFYPFVSEEVLPYRLISSPRPNFVQLYPSPAYDLLNIEFDRPLNTTVLLRIINSEGNLILVKNVSSFGYPLHAELDISHLLPGAYLIRMEAPKFCLRMNFRKITC